MSWTLKCGDSVGQFAAFGITDVTRTRKNLMADRVTFRIDGDSLLSPPAFAANETVQIFSGNTRWFSGVVTQTPLRCSPNGESYTYELSGPWWYLENLIYQQPWKEPLDPSNGASDLRDVYKSHIILGQAVTGERLTIGQQIGDIINYAISCGVPIASGSMDIGVSIPLDECKDLSCADAIRRLLRWVPDVVSTVDYALDIAAISFLRRSQMKSTSISLESGIGELFLRPRYDLQVPAVVLKFETTNSANGKTWKELVVQRYPDGCSGTELKALVLTINLEGSKSNYLIQSIETEPIDTASVSWWKAHVPLLSGIESSTISIANASRGSALPNELMSGTIANWMDREAETDVIRCQISYDGEDEAISGRTAAVRIVATDATSGVYKKLLSLTTAEIVPQNLAEQIYAAVNPLHYDGTVTIVGEEISQNFIGKLLNICGGQPAWEAMNAVVQEVSEQLDSGYTVVKFGPAKHLGAADLAELTRSGRLLFTSTNSSERSTAEASGNGVVEQGIFSRVDNTSFGSGSYRMMKFSDPENPAVVVRIDTADVPMDAATAKFREEDVCDSGVLKKRYSLATEPFLPE